MTSQRIHSWSRQSVAFTVFLLTGIGPVAGQSVTGTVWDSLTNQPVGNGFVVLLDIDGREVVRALASASGTFRIMAPTSGTYAIRSERIGFRATQSKPFSIAQGEIHDVDLYTTSLPTMLEAMEINTQRKCDMGSDNQSTLLVAWEEVRKALAASVWEGNDRVRYRRYSYTRELPANRRRIDHEEGNIAEVLARQPYQSRPIEELLQTGYIVDGDTDIQYSLPDASTLLHDSFLDQHCFQVVTNAQNRPGQLGLAFTPAALQRGLAQVRGTLWIGQDTWELTQLEVEYTELPGGLDDKRAGGTVDYLQLPSGAWIINHWELRTPVIQLVAPDARVFDRGGEPVPTVVGFTDHGGTVLEIDAGTGDVLYPARLAHVMGTVVDSSSRTPLSNVRVQLDDTGFSAETDELGAYHLTAPLVGDYDVTVSSDALSALAQQLTYPVTLNQDSVFSLDVLVPPLTDIVARTCATSDSTPHTTVVGTVTWRQRPVRGATVTASWQTVEVVNGRRIAADVERAIVTNESGYYTLCGVPQGNDVRIRAEYEGRTSQTGHMLYTGPAVNSLLFGWDRVADAAYPRRYTSNTAGAWKVDLILDGRSGTPVASTTRSGSVVTGYVTDQSTNLPVGGVKVIVNGTDSALSRNDGTFAVPYTSIGSNTIVTLRGIGYSPWIGAIEHDTVQATLDVHAAIESRAYTLAPIEVTSAAAERLLTSVGFYQRQNTNFGHFMSPEDVVQRSGAAHSVADLFRHFPDVNVLTNSVGAGSLGISVQLKGLGTTNCVSPRVYVDGMVLETGGTSPVASNVQREEPPPQLFHVLSSGLLHPDEILAIEIYTTASQVPIEFGGANSACGVIVIWTHRGN